MSASKLIFAPGENPSDTGAPSQAAQFKVGTLYRTDLDPDPFVQFHAWFSDPRLEGTVPETCTLSTARLPSGRVSSRVVYLKELDDRGFVVYSNFGTSQKAADLLTNPHASLNFWHKPTERQICIQGLASRLTPEESQVYYDTRARGSRIGAWASQQSSVLEPQSQSTASDPQKDESSPPDDGRHELNAQVSAVESRFAGQDPVPVPPFWGGLRIVPDMIEFWQGRESRLHDRFRYTLLNDESNGNDLKAEKGANLNRGLAEGAASGEAMTSNLLRSNKSESAGEKKWKIERLSP